MSAAPKGIRVSAPPVLIRAEARCSERSVVLRVPVKLVSESNAREHHMERHRRNKAQQAVVAAVASMVRTAQRPPSPEVGGWHMRFTRVAPARLDPGNLDGSFKHVQDAIAAWLGVKNERDARYLSWVYEQRSEGARVWGCEIEVTW